MQKFGGAQTGLNKYHLQTNASDSIVLMKDTLRSNTMYIFEGKCDLKAK